ncbi:MAG TPA: ATP-dependent 6-phosphofructokinase [Candidatus Omnitrophota bacterium]|jgi:6-phosphofructokinase 1|nr:ATP-dependent 6-phosphofructokinase [Candidatus Omnitrophota bacterium]
MPAKKKIAVLTGGGDCPGLNGVIRAVTKKAILELGWSVIGVEDGYEGLIKGKFRQLDYQDVSGILTLGGTILGTSNKASPYKYIDPKDKTATPRDVSRKVIKTVQELDIGCLVCIGGDGTLKIASHLFEDGIPIIGVPKTIDNDIRGTDITFGFDTAVGIATEGVDRLHTTAQAHHRVMILEVMGRTAGWIALHSGIAGGGDIILLPEIPYDIDVIARRVKERSRKGKRFSILVVSEGAKPKGGTAVVRKLVKDASEPVRLGGVSFILADQIEQITGLESRAVVLGHLQRGGSPSSYDRVLATQFGARAVDLILERKFGTMVGMKGGDLVSVPLQEVAIGPRLVPEDHFLIGAARSVGTFFGNR